MEEEEKQEEEEEEDVVWGVVMVGSVPLDEGSQVMHIIDLGHIDKLQGQSQPACLLALYFVEWYFEWREGPRLSVQ